jgi:hypothetical protein
MHESQIEALLRMIDMFLSTAEVTGDQEIFEEALEMANDLVILFGGNGVSVEYVAYY